MTDQSSVIFLRFLASNVCFFFLRENIMCMYLCQGKFSVTFFFFSSVCVRGKSLFFVSCVRGSHPLFFFYLLGEVTFFVFYIRGSHPLSFVFCLCQGKSPVFYLLREVTFFSSVYVRESHLSSFFFYLCQRKSRFCFLVFYLCQGNHIFVSSICDIELFFSVLGEVTFFFSALFYFGKPFLFFTLIMLLTFIFLPAV